MLHYIKYLLYFIVIGLATIIAVRLLARLLNIVPGLFVALSALSLIALLVALYRGSFRAVGLHSRKSIIWAMLAAFVLFVGSFAVLVNTQ